MAPALGWGALAASSLVLGALLAFARHWPHQQLGYVLAFGAGALISAVSYELVQEGIDVGGGGSTALGLGAGAFAYYFADGAVARRFSGGRGMPGRMQGSAPGQALALGAFLDGVPEQLVLGISVASGKGVGVGLLVAIFVSNLPESIGSSSEMERTGTERRTILRLWIAVGAICVLATLAGYAVADTASEELRAGVNGFAAGALIVLLIDSLIPEATKQAGRTAGLVTTLGFAVAAGLSTVS
jgi:zinc transporter, ZIP family